MLMRLAIAVCLILALVALGGGCISNTFGSSSLTADNVNQIKKGVTTRADIEAIFGPPENVTMMSDGKRVMQYSFTQSNMHTDPQSFIPVVQIFAAQAEGQTTTRSLQVELDANNIVVDYQFNDSTSNLKVGTFGSSSTPVANPAPVNSSQP